MFSWLFVRILVRVAIRMSRKALWTLQSDPEFQCVSMPLPGEEFQTLEKAITSGRVREPVAVWHRIMIEAYPRYEIYTRHGIKFALEEMVFPSKTDAVLWACERQLRRGHIVTAARHYLLGKLYLTAKEKSPKAAPAELARRISAEFGVSPASLLEYKSFTNKMDLLRHKEPELADGILSGKYALYLRKFTNLDHKSSRELWAMAHTPGKGGNLAPGPLPAPTVKDMPAFDPDGPLMSLVLTIPSWVNVLENSGGRHSFSQASPVCREKLEQALYNLYAAAESALAALWEE